MPLPAAPKLVLSESERKQLLALSRHRSTPRGIVVRVNIVLGAAEGIANHVLARRLSTSLPTVLLWRRRYESGGLAAVVEDPRSGRPKQISEQREAAIVEATIRTTPRDATHWSVRTMAASQKLSPATVQRVWARAGLQPHRLERYVTSNDPDFERKAADVLGLYLHPPAHAAVFCVDEKTAIQALDRLDPGLPLSPGRAERHGFEYYRHGTLSLYAALEVGTGHVEGRTVPRHTSAAFVAFLDQVLATQPKRREIHLICDNLSAHKTLAVRQWLALHPRVTIHYTPTYSSWLNQVELWFAKIERDCIARGIFTSTTDLRRKLMQYIRLHNKTCRPFHWTYRSPKRRIRTSAA